MKTGKKIAIGVLAVIIIGCGSVVWRHWEAGQMTISTGASTTDAPADDGHALERHNRVVAGATAIKHAARNPSSVVFVDVWTAPDNTACFRYTAANAFGAPVAGAAMVTPGDEKIVVSDSAAHTKAWNARCTLSAHTYTWLARQQ